jgi:ribosomal protein S18 acetylase RimI-like enzyme
MIPETPYSITQANWRDVGELRQLEKECFGEDSWPLWDIIGVLTMPGVVRLKAVMNERMVGFIGGDVQRGENTGWITTLGVFPAQRRLGIAAALLAECETQMGMNHVKLCVRKSNDPAILLYKRAGYQQIDIWHRYYSGGEDALVLEKIRKP